MFKFEKFKSYAGGTAIVASVSPVWPEAIEQVPGGGTVGSGVQHADAMQVTSCWAAACVFGPSGIYMLEQK